MILKLDPEKPYDRMEWGFVKETLHDALLPSGHIGVIMGIV